MAMSFQVRDRRLHSTRRYLSLLHIHEYLTAGSGPSPASPPTKRWVSSSIAKVRRRANGPLNQRPEPHHPCSRIARQTRSACPALTVGDAERGQGIEDGVHHDIARHADRRGLGIHF